MLLQKPTGEIYSPHWTCYIQANFFENTLNMFIKDNSPVLGRKHQVVQQYRHVVAFVFGVAHVAKLPKRL
jgi:hypothetical protein